MSWRDVFDGAKGRWIYVNDAAECAMLAGYVYLAWNGEILALSETTYEDGTKVMNIVASGIPFKELH